jgi:hypothetical protein
MNEYGAILLTFAEVAATLTGFIGVVFILAEEPRGVRSIHESSALFHLLFSALSALFLSLFTAVLLTYSAADEHFAWRIANTLSGFVHLLGAGRLVVEMSQQKSGMQRGIVASTIGIGTAGASFMAAAGYLAREEALIFMLATLWALGVTVIAFVSLLISAQQDGTKE